jgi:hypothetical protein
LFGVSDKRLYVEQRDQGDYAVRRSGRPHFVRPRDGREVIVVSKECFHETKPNLKSYLMESGYADAAADAFDIAMSDIRTVSPPRNRK